MLRHIHYPRVIEQRRDARQVSERTLAVRQVIDGQHRVGFAAAEGSLQLDDWLTTFAIEPLCHLGKQRPMPSVMKVRS